MDLSIIIVSYKSKHELPSCLVSIPPACSGLEYEIIVVDNGSNDGSPEYLTSEDNINHLVLNDENRGFSKACNQGSQKSQGEYLAFINPDTECTLLSLFRLVEYPRAHPFVAAAGPKLVSGDDTTSNSCFRFPSIIRPTFNFALLRPIIGYRFALQYPVDHPSRTTGGSVEWISGACIVVSRTAFDDIGGFDENYFMYFEDTDLCFRLTEKGLEIHYRPESVVKHHSGRSTEPVADRMKFEVQRSRLTYLSRHYN